MRLHFFILTFLLNLPLPSSASDPSLVVKKWACFTTVLLKGEPNHFVMYGRDSWRGTSHLMCSSGLASVTEPVDINYNSLQDGFGADSRSTFILTVELNSILDPEDLQVRSYVTNYADQESVLWSFSTHATSGRAVIASPDVLELKRSLQMGTIFIRRALE